MTYFQKSSNESARQQQIFNDLWPAILQFISLTLRNFILGIEQHADHFAELSVVSVWLEDMSSEMAYDGKDISLNSSDVGTMEAFENLTKTFNKKGKFNIFSASVIYS